MGLIPRSLGRKSPLLAAGLFNRIVIDYLSINHYGAQNEMPPMPCQLTG